MHISDPIQSQLEQLDLGLTCGDFPSEIEELLAKSVLFGGKRLRPLLLFLVGECFDLSPLKLAPFAAAIEQIHAASLSHDDVVDNGTIRRGRPTLNQLKSNKHAVLAGDYLLADVLSKIVDQDCPYIMKETARVIQDLAQGEWLQLETAESRAACFDNLRKIAINKTGSAISWCMVIPAVLAGMSEPQIAIMRDLGQRLGLAYQMIDDSIDMSEASLKDMDADVSNGQINFVLADYFEHNPKEKELFLKGSNIELTIEKRAHSQANIRNAAAEEVESIKRTFQALDIKLDDQATSNLLGLFDMLATRSF